jgi:hypothetical protein
MNTQARARAMLVSPKAEWEVIAAEQTDVASIYRNYIVILAAIPAVCSFVGLTIDGFRAAGGASLVGAVRVSVAAYVSALVSPFVAAIVIEKLAPKFQSRGGLVPALLPLSIVAALYAIYLFYVGLPAIMKTPIEQVVPFMAIAALTTVVVGVVLRWVAAAMGVPRYGF